jgi:arsenate reductase-like glutaredoxin family protein
MNKKIILFTLDYCDHCKKTKQLLDQARIKYTHVSCEDSPESCDELEKLLGIFNYPIAKIEQDSSNYYFYLAKKAKDLEPRPISRGISVQGSLNEEELVKQILNT